MYFSRIGNKVKDRSQQGKFYSFETQVARNEWTKKQKKLGIRVVAVTREEVFEALGRNITRREDGLLEGHERAVGKIAKTTSILSPPEITAKKPANNSRAHKSQPCISKIEDHPVESIEIIVRALLPYAQGQTIDFRGDKYKVVSCYHSEREQAHKTRVQLSPIGKKAKV